MKKVILLITVLTSTIIAAQTVSIPDSNFEQALIDLGIDTNGANNSVLLSDIQDVTILDVSNKNISNLSGIEDFASLTNLVVSDNNLTTIELSEITTLELLNCSSNQITALDVSQNTALNILICGNNLLNSLDVTQNIALTNLNCYGNSLSSLDVSQNTNLIVLTCHANALSCLDLSQNTLLKTLSGHSNQLTSLDVSLNIALENLHVAINQIKSLNLVYNIELVNFYAHTNQLSYLNVKNGNNTSFTNFHVPFNPNLTCIEVDNVSYSESNWTDIDSNSSFSTDCNQQAYVFVPDDNFEQALIDLGYDCFLDDYVPAANLNTLTQLDVGNKNIFDFTGINSFTALEWLNIGVNPISQSITFNINNLTALTYLNCINSQLTFLDVSQNLALETLLCNNNNLNSLNMSSNLNLSYLDCFNNQINNLNVTQNTALTHLNCRSNNLSSLDVTQNSALTLLYCHLNELESLDLTQNPVLEVLNCGANQLISLDLSLNIMLTELECHFNELTSLNAKNGNNTNITIFSSANNSNLSCIEVDDAAYSAANWTNIDPQTSFSEDCFTQTFIPDDNFEQALIDLGYDSGPLDDFVLTANINTITLLAVQSSNIVDLTGIEDFAALQLLDCSNNQIINADLSANTNLTGVFLSNNDLETLNLKTGNTSNLEEIITVNNPNLLCIEVDDPAYATNFLSDDIDDQTLFSQDCSGGLTYVPDDNFEQALIDQGYDFAIDDYVSTAPISMITFLDVSNKNISDLTGIQDFTGLTDLICRNNQLIDLDISQNTALTRLLCENNQLTNLDLSQNIALTNLNCSNNQISNIDLSLNVNLEILGSNDNLLTSLDISQNINLELLSAFRNQLTSLNVSQNLILESINVFQNEITSIDISQNTTLTNLQIDSNLLESLDVSQNSALESLSFANNQVTNFDANQNPALAILTCNTNQLVNLDLSPNSALTYLQCSNNALTSLNVRNGNNTNVTLFDASNNPNLFCIEVDDVDYSESNWSFDPQTDFSKNCKTLNTTNFDLEKALTLFPNPASEIVNIKTANNTLIETIEIYNISGKRLQTSSSSADINVSSLASGIYLLKITTDSQTVIKKLVVN